MADHFKLVSFPTFIVLYGLFGMLIVMSGAEDEGGSESHSESQSRLRDFKEVVDKRYLAALAKNGRLPKFSNTQKKDQQSQESVESNFQRDLSAEVPGDLWLDEKRHVGAFLKSKGKPSFMRLVGDGHARYDRSTSFVDDEGAADETGYVVDSDTNVKRNVASLARLGRLNAVRYAHFQPHYVGGKRLNSNSDELNDSASNNNEDNEIDVLNDPDCEDDEEPDEDDAEANYAHPNWIQKKRYVAALARSGRLPMWHSQRMWWGGKRDTPTAYWLRSRSGARGNAGKRENAIEETGFIKPKNKRCRKLSKGDFLGGNEEKRNMAMLARKGQLPYRSSVTA